MRRRPQRSDELLLDAASKVFAREGYAAASVARIAEQASATKPTLYARFGSKARLYDATLRYHADAIRPQLFAAYDRAPELELGDAIREGVEAWFAYAHRRPDGMKLLFGDDTGTESQVAAETVEAIVQKIAAVIETLGARVGNPAGRAAPVVAAMIVGACVHAIRRCLSEPSLDPAVVADLTTSFLIAACRGLDTGLYARLNDCSAAVD